MAEDIRPSKLVLPTAYLLAQRRLYYTIRQQEAPQTTSYDHPRASKCRQSLLARADHVIIVTASALASAIIALCSATAAGLAARATSRSAMHSFRCAVAPLASRRTPSHEYIHPNFPNPAECQIATQEQQIIRRRRLLLYRNSMKASVAAVRSYAPPTHSHNPPHATVQLAARSSPYHRPSKPDCANIDWPLAAACTRRV